MMFKGLQAKKRGQLQQVPGVVILMASIALALILAGLITAFGLDVKSDIDSTFTAGSAAANASADFDDGIENLANQAGNVGNISGAVIVLGLILLGFGGFLFIRNR